ncbi:Eco57I restriction-modification methylase domain-containing protein [Anaeromicropila herbilytica]|uniref:site-specific DNA-methyltransferase (adenine-specific) n=1 Tax=Anaeromicropila herbilytica TaxID=2785025 RepID=A0A7R7IFA9_9FIRM|nr:DNA methyltransferase [Anaeromicropila herbilytica]BCN32989.1 restriction endonuclease subunit M [Anaeromicropila herbilytica]
MNKEKLSKLINEFHNNIEFYKSSNYNESECRLNFIDKLLKIFGWDVDNEKMVAPQYREVVVESYDSNTGRPDYSMTLNGVTKFFVEAKKPSVPIEEKGTSAFQARSYGWTAKHPIAVLTNFEYLVIYDTSVMPSVEEGPMTALIGKYHYTEYLDKFEEIDQLISRESVYCGNFDKQYQFVDKYKTLVDDMFLKQINDWRLELGKYLHNKQIPIEIINDETQGFINQIIFLRICEDRKLPTYRTLYETIHDEDMVEEKMSELLRDAEAKYNTGILKGNHLRVDMNEKVIHDMIEMLYYPKSPYAFNIIKADLLGRIYEMFLVEHLAVNEYNQLILKQKNEALNRDVVSTPVPMVKYMVKKSLAELVDNKSPEEIKRIHIADISCGSGVFLLEAYEYLLNACTEWYINNDKAHLVELQKGVYKLPIAEKKEILLKCIYGVDIDYHACEVAKFTLLLKLLEQETEASILSEVPVLPDLSLNIQMGNALVDSDMIEKYQGWDDIEDINPFDWSLINDGKKFTIILGNPPYVKTSDMIKFSSAKEIEIYKKVYESAYKQFDRYFLFVERACNLLEERGSLCYFIPNKFAKIEAGKKLRELLTKARYVKEYTDFGSVQFFKEKDKTIYSSILYLQKEPQDSFIFREVTDGEEWMLNNEKTTKYVQLDCSIINQEPWILTTDTKLLSDMEHLYKKSVLVEDEYDVFNGIQTSAEQPIPVYWFSDKEIVEEEENYYKIYKFDQYYRIEKAILRPYFKPNNQKERQISTYDAYETNKWIIFPYDNEGKLIQAKRMMEEYPYTLAYLKDRYSIIVPRQISGRKTDRDVPYAEGHPDDWYQYGRNQGLTRFNGTEKLIIGVMWRDYPKYLYDKKNYIIASGETAGFCGIAQKQESRYTLEFLQAYLMHPLIARIIVNRGSNFDKGYVTNGTGILRNLPLIKIDFTNEQISNKYESINQDARKIYEINDRLLQPLGNKEITILTRQKQVLVKKIAKNMDEMIHES